MHSSRPPRTAAASVVASNAHRVLHFAASRGFDLERAQLALPSESDRQARIPAAQMFALWARVVRELDAADLPVALAHGARLEQLDLLGLVILTAPTLLDALQTFARYDALLSDGRSWTVRVDRSHLTIQCVSPEPLSLGVRISHETTLAQLVTCVRQLAAAPIDPVRVSFRHAAPRRLPGHRELFRCELDFGASEYEVSFDRASAVIVPPLASRALWSYLRAQADGLLGQLAPQSFRRRVTSEAARLLEADVTPAMPRIARGLGLSERSLRRALEGEGVHFRELLDEVRKVRAATLLARPNASISEVALRVGFADASAFSHACRRWFGKTPRALAKSESADQGQ